MKGKFIYNLIYQFIQLIIPLILLPYVNRVLGPTNVGAYNFSLTVANYFLLFAMLGVNNYGCRCIAMVQTDLSERSKKFFSIYIIQVISSFLSLLAYLFYLHFFVKDYKIIAVIQIIFVISGMFDINWFFFGMEQFKITVTRNLCIKILTTFLVFLLVKTPEDLVLYTVIYSVGFLLSQASVWLFMKKMVKFVKINIKDFLEHIKPIFILFLPIIAISLYKYMDKIMLGMLTDYSQVAFYTNVETIISVPAIITVALGTIALPRLTALYAKGDLKSSFYYIDLSLQFSMCISCAMAFGMASISDMFSVFYFGEDFSECSILILLAFPMVLFQSWATIIRMQFLIPRQFDKIYIVSIFSGAVVNGILNMSLIPIIGSRGAIIGTLFAEFIVAFIQSYSVRKYLPIIQLLKNNVFYVFIGILMFIVVWVVKLYLPMNIISLFILIFIGAAIYLTLSLIYNWRKKTLLFYSVMDSINKIKNLGEKNGKKL